jgi:hypothetical protein
VGGQLLQQLFGKTGVHQLMGGGCKLGMTASELAVRAAAWATEIEARRQLTAECFPDSDTGHQRALKQAEDALKNCQEIPPAPWNSTSKP